MVEDQKGEQIKTAPVPRCAGVREPSVAQQDTNLGDVIVPPLPLLLLQLNGDAPHRTPLDPLHQMGDIPGPGEILLPSHVDTAHSA